jgi:hypothetical protein
MKPLCRLIVALVAGVWTAGVQADEQEDEIPDLEFLEYLGSWQESDEEWLIVSEWEEDRVPRADGRPEAEADEND